MAQTNQTTYGYVGSFPTTPEVYCAAQKVRDSGFKKWDVFTPFPVHGMDEAMGLKRSKVPIFTLLGGLAGILTGLFMTWYMNGYDYPLIVGGKPMWSPIYPFPVYYELTILFGAFGTFFGMWLMNRLPQPYHPLFNMEQFKKASDDTFFILIESQDSKFDLNETKSFLESIGASDITLIEE